MKSIEVKPDTTFELNCIHIAMIDESLCILKSQYNEFKNIYGKNDCNIRHLKGKIEGIEYVLGMKNY